jgi:hypothetical protein
MKKQGLVVLLLSSIVIIGVAGCKAKKVAPIPQATPQSDSKGIITQNSTGDCSTNVVSTGNQDVNIQSPCPGNGQHNVTKINPDAAIGTINQTSSGNDSVNAVVIGQGSVDVAIAGNDGFRSPKEKVLRACGDGSKPTGGYCADGTVPQKLHPTNHKR